MLSIAASRRLSKLEEKAHIHDPPQPVIFVILSARGGRVGRAGRNVMIKCGSERREKQRKIFNTGSLKNYNGMKIVPAS